MSDRDFFEREVWPKVMGSTCISCHTMAGAAAEVNAKFLLQPSAYPGFLPINYENARGIAQISVGGTSELLLKPTGQLVAHMAHGGGTLFTKDDPRYAILEEFVARSNNPSACEDAPPVIAGDGIPQMDDAHTLRKATLLLGGRLPTAAEKAAVDLDATLDRVMTEPAFLDWVVTIYNDTFLTDRYLSYTGRGVDLLNLTDWPNAGEAYDSSTQAQKELGNLAVTREPLQLIAHVVKTDRPFTEILTADYMMVNPYSAKIYGLPTSMFADPTNADDWQEAKLTVKRGTNQQVYPFPHAGVLSSPMWLNRYPTTPTNRGRGRARQVYSQFLATDILAVADRPVDPAASTAFLNPTRDDPQCKVCHAQIDPIAGDFQKWNPYDQEVYEPTTNWYGDMAAPGFGGESMDSSDFPRALPWLAEHVAEDSRFPISVARKVFTGVTGQDVLPYPKLNSPDYEAERAAFAAQDAAIQEIANAFMAGGFNFKAAVKAAVKSPYFRMDGAAHLSTPEELARKIVAVTGAQWVSYNRKPQITQEYNIAYGGIDSDLVNDRLTAPNGMISGVAWRMANEVSCNMTAWDFTRPAGERNLFPGIEYTDRLDVDGVEPKIRATLVHLHEQILGETLAADDPEIERTYDLLMDTWHEGTAAITADASKKNLLYQCWGRIDPRTGDDLTTKITSDPDYTIRAWMAVMTYLLADYRFLHS